MSVSPHAEAKQGFIAAMLSLPLAVCVTGLAIIMAGSIV